MKLSAREEKRKQEKEKRKGARQKNTKDVRLKNKGYRMLVVEKYLVFYIVKDKTVQIRRIIHGARNYNFLL